MVATMINSNDISVVVQGAIDKENTPKCLKSIRKYLPDAEIILSTWEGSDVSNLDYDVLVLNKDPGGYKHDFAIYNKSRSMNNFNRQLVSAQNGVFKANRKYCLKLRSDLELNNSNFIKYWDKFNKQNDEYKIFKHRVLCSSIYSREYSCNITGNSLPTPFHPSDFWFFGLTEDLKDYFCACPMQTREEASNWTFKYPNRLPYSSMLWKFAPEQFFCVNWVKKHYPNIQFYDWSDWNPENIEFSNNILYNNFIFLDYEQSGIYSDKHSEAIKNIYKINGLITFRHFQHQYKQYCNGTYKYIKDASFYKYKLKQHYRTFMLPFRYIKSWIGEIFSLLYYFFAVIFSSIFGVNNHDRK